MKLSGRNSGALGSNSNPSVESKKLENSNGFLERLEEDEKWRVDFLLLGYRAHVDSLFFAHGLELVGNCTIVTKQTVSRLLEANYSS